MNDTLPLRDIHLPEIIGFDFGAWVFMLTLMVGSIVCLYILSSWLKKRNTQKTVALLELEKLYLQFINNQDPQGIQAHQYVKDLSLLIRRYVYSLNSNAPIHLTGSSFYEWLEHNGANINLNAGVGKYLIDLPYKKQNNPKEILSFREIEALHELGQKFFKSYSNEDVHSC